MFFAFNVKKEQAIASAYDIFYNFGALINIKP